MTTSLWRRARAGLSLTSVSVSPWRLLFLLLVVLPLAVGLFVKPFRLLAPTLNGLTCPEPGICLDQPARLAEARALRRDALSALASGPVGAPGPTPRLLFCATQACADAFGLGPRSALTVGHFGSVIGPKAWKDHYLRHELIHQMQAEQLGLLCSLTRPRWLLEGMAYALSADPRHPLASPWEADRAQFLAWYAALGDPARLWSAARQVD